MVCLDEVLRKELRREELKRQYKNKKIISPKYFMKYPDSAEREYLRMINAYMGIEKEVLLKYLPELKMILNENTAYQNDTYHMDSKKSNEKKRKLARFSVIDNTIVRLKIFLKSFKKSLLLPLDFIF